MARAGGAARDVAQRDVSIDAMRAVAIAGVLIVNAVSYPDGPAGSPLGAPMPPDSAAAITAFMVIAWLVQGKAYPLLAFLFGCGLALAVKRHHAGQVEYRRRRLVKLLALGVAHGAVFYAGDILTIYGVCGLIVLAGARTRLRVLLHRWFVLCAFVLIIVVADALMWSQAPLAWASGGLGSSYRTVLTLSSFLALNSGSYLASLSSSLVLFLPEVLMLSLAGFIAGRLGLLTHRRWSGQCSAFARAATAPALLLNLGYALFMAWAVRNERAVAWVGLALAPPACWLLSLVLCINLSLWWQERRPGLLAALAPLGQYTLSLYVGHSIACMLLFSGAGLALRLGTVGMLSWAAALWMVAWLAATWARRHGVRGPLEAWMIRP